MLTKLLKIKRARRRLLVEATVSLVWSKAMLRCLPFPWLEALLGRRVKGRETMGLERERLCREVRSAVERISGFLPRTMVCFPRAIAVQSMLRRRGVSTTIVYGAQASGDLTAHVWVQDGKRDVIGMPAEGEFTVVATFSPLLQP